MQDRKDWEKQQRRNRIVDIAEELFDRCGYEQVTVDEIAAAAGYTKRSFYNYFSDKEEIFLAVVLRGLDTLNTRLQEARRKEPLVRALAETYFRFFIDHPLYFKLIMRYESRLCIYYGDKSRQGTFQTACQQATDTTAAIVTAAIAQAQQQGAIASRLLPRQLMLVVWGQVSGFLQIVLMRREHFSDAFGIGYQELFDEFVNMLEQALLLKTV